MESFIGVLKEFGPFTVPLCIAMAYALVWMKKQVDKQEKRALAAEDDAKQLRDQRTKELVEATQAMGQFGEAMSKRIEQHDDNIERLLDELEKRRA